jgi:hypothetical protein
MSTPTAGQAEYEALAAAHMAMTRAYMVKLKAGEDLAGLSGVAWLNAFNAERFARQAYIGSCNVWEATVRDFVETVR